MTTNRFSALLLLLVISFSTFAREGMWIPILLDRNIAEMHEMGFKLNTNDIYSMNNTSMKDAIVLFGGGCTGELISPDGLLITNHHCGYSQVQAHSTVENDYLTNGFWAMNRSDELPNDGLSVTFLVEMRDVSTEILAGTDSISNEALRIQKIRENTDTVTQKAIEGTHYEAVVKPFYEGNQYFLFVTEKFTDVRLVGAPPSAIGKFGGDTDNWMWPRHTGDFSLFRIYADSTNKPAAYSPNNVPYQPKMFFPINISGIEKNDFTMVFGYPGTTQQYLYSDAVRQLVEQRDPDRIAIRDIKLNSMRSAMETSPATRIQYAAKYASTSNAWKKWQGEINGLKRLDAVNVKLEEEKAFTKWVNTTPERQEKYGDILHTFEKKYNEIASIQKAKDYYDEIIFRGTDAYRMFNQLQQVINSGEQPADTEFIEKHFKDYTNQVDKTIFVSLIEMLHTDIVNNMLAPLLLELSEKNKTEKKLEKLYSGSVLNSKDDLMAVCSKNDIDKIKKKVEKDKLYRFFDDIYWFYFDSIYASYNAIQKEIDNTYQTYIEALLEMNEDEMLFPDANLTMRVTYGKVEGYEPADGVEYKHYTTLDGIIEKDNPEIYDYNVPEKLKQLHREQNYGRYANPRGELPVCFTASNHTTGGNSGSPVINAEGHLIGINFDRCWEGTMSDIMFDPEKCRNISLDMRYMLFLVDKFAGASYLLDEMEIVQ
ncbi:MAG: S46 family peptidase [Prolixibacteraceae bacterium]|nr:S46 family peptidase [Prolixibacteraceae bacterium]MBN2649257.1 S46 family peptidase [Prolixibacteraceae bacterium]